MYNKNKFIKILSIVLLLLVSISSIPFASNTEAYDYKIYNHKSSSKNLNYEAMYYGDDMTWDGDLGGAAGGGCVIPYVPGIPDTLKDIIVYVKRKVKGEVNVNGRKQWIENKEANTEEKIGGMYLV